MTVSKEVGKVLADRIRSEFYRGTPPGEALEIVKTIFQQRPLTEGAAYNAGECSPKRIVKP